MEKFLAVVLVVMVLLTTERFYSVFSQWFSSRVCQRSMMMADRIALQGFGTLILCYVRSVEIIICVCILKYFW